MTKISFTRDEMFLDSNLRKANKRVRAIQVREGVGFVRANRDRADRIAAGRARFRYTCELLYVC